MKRVDAWKTKSGKIECSSSACADAGLSAMPIWVAPHASSNIARLVDYDMNLGQQNLERIIKKSAVGAPAKETSSEPDAKRAEELYDDTAAALAPVVAYDGDDAKDTSHPELENESEKRLTFHLITGVQTVVGEVGANTPELMDIAQKYALDSVWINSDIASVLNIKTGDEVCIASNNNSGKVQAFVTDRIVPTAVYLPAGFGHTSDAQTTSKGVGLNAYKFSPPLVKLGYGTLCTQEACVWLWKEGA